MKKIIFILIITHSSLLICSAQSGWFPLNSGTTSLLFSSYFLNSSTGFVGSGSFGGGSVLRTTDGGMNWIPTSMTVPVYSIYFTDNNVGYAVGSRLFMPPDPPELHGRVYKTYDSGLSWSQIYDVNGYYLTSVFFPNSSFGFMAAYTYISGSYPYVFKTANGGVGWTYQSLSTGYQNNCVFFPNINTGYTAGSVMYKTTNNGINWVMNLSGYSLNSLYFIDANTGYSCGYGGVVLRTTDGGNWFPQTTNTTVTLYSIFFIGNNTGYTVGGSGKILKTTNGGNNWLTQTSGTTNTLYSAFFTDSLTGYAAGSNGTILKTTTGGIVPVKPNSNRIPDKFKLYQNFPNPFNPTTKIRFDIPANGKGGMSDVKLIVYDALGREVASTINDEFKPGTYEVELDATSYPSGIYFYILSSDSFKETKRMVLLR